MEVTRMPRKISTPSTTGAPWIREDADDIDIGPIDLDPGLLVISPADIAATNRALAEAQRSGVTMALVLQATIIAQRRMVKDLEQKRDLHRASNSKRSVLSFVSTLRKIEKKLTRERALLAEIEASLSKLS